jgi:hypothetical protein
MTMFVFVGLIGSGAIGLCWGSMAVALRQSPPEQVTMEEDRPESDWPITPANFRM